MVLLEIIFRRFLTFVRLAWFHPENQFNMIFLFNLFNYQHPFRRLKIPGVDAVQINSAG